MSNSARYAVEERIKEDGFVCIDRFFDEQDVLAITGQLERHGVFDYNKPAQGEMNVLKALPFIRQLAHSPELINLVKQALGAYARPVHAFVIDKNLESNWALDWHQDLKIAVKAKLETEGYSNWTLESGIVHVVPPLQVQQKRLSIRIHLDDCSRINGAIRVLPASHKNGIIHDQAGQGQREEQNGRYCELHRGGIMLFSPLLLHQSPYSNSIKKRRVLQVEYTGAELDNGIEWR